MNETGSNEGGLENLSREEVMSALFGHMIIQNANMALMFLGQTPHPQSGEKVKDLEAAKMFIDQLEMLEGKTKGNLTREEEKLLQQSLMHLRMTFVQVIENSPASEPEKKTESPAPAASAAETASGASGGEAEAESRKRFSKKF